MKAIRVTQYGEPEVLQVQEVPLPEPGPGQARVRLRTAGVNFVDIYHRRGTYALDRPFTPGREGAGVVDVVGEGVTTVRPGERVAFTGHPGAYAEACLVPADSLIALPDDVSFEVGAAFPLQGMTAHYLLHEFHRTRKELLHRAGDVLAGIRMGWVRLRIDRTLPLEQAAAAHRALEGRETIGKVLLRVAGP